MGVGIPSMEFKFRGTSDGKFYKIDILKMIQENIDEGKKRLFKN